MIKLLIKNIILIPLLNKVTDSPKEFLESSHHYSSKQLACKIFNIYHFFKVSSSTPITLCNFPT